MSGQRGNYTSTGPNVMFAASVIIPKHYNIELDFLPTCKLCVSTATRGQEVKFEKI